MGGTRQRGVHPTRYSGLFEDGSEAAVDRLDALLGGMMKAAGERRLLAIGTLS